MAVKNPELSSFIFLSGYDKTYSGHIRAHVLKRHMRRRKENSLVLRGHRKDRTYQSRGIDGEYDEVAETTSGMLNQRRSQATISCTHNTLCEADPCRVSPRNTYLLEADTCSPSSAVACPSSVIPLVDHHPGPSDVLTPRASRTILPDLTHRQAYLFHHLLTGVTADLFSFNTKRAQFHPVRDIFASQFASQEIGLTLALYCASTHLARLAGGLPSQEELQSEAALCRSLSKRLSCKQTQADEFSIIAVLGMICVDVQVRPQDHSPEGRARLSSHIRGLREMIRQRGGWSALRNSPVAFYLHWFDIVCAGEISLGLTPTSQYLENAHEAHSHLELCVTELCAFYRSLSYQQVSFIGHLVEPGSIVAGLLANLENSVLPERLAALIYLCATFNDLGYSPSRMRYIGRLEEKLASQALRLEASLVGLVWSLIADFDNLILECPERTWLLSRLLYVAARLSADLRRKLGNQLLRFLTSDRRDNLLLDPEDVEAEIWRDIALVKVKEDRAGTAT